MSHKGTCTNCGKKTRVRTCRTCGRSYCENCAQHKGLFGGTPVCPACKEKLPSN